MKTWQRMLWTMFSLSAVCSIGLLDWNTFMQGIKWSHSIVVLLDSIAMSLSTGFVDVFSLLTIAVVWESDAKS